MTRRQDLAEHLRVTVFAPDDLALVKGGPAGRREFLDDLLVAAAPRFAGVITDYERVLKQRNALLRAGIRTNEDRTTRDVLDARLVESGAELICGRLDLIARLTPEIEDAYTVARRRRVRFRRRVRTRVGRRAGHTRRRRGWADRRARRDCANAKRIAG